MNYNPYASPLHSYPQLDALRQQLPQQQYPQPYAQQPPQQMPSIQALIQQEVQRQIAGMQPQYQPQQQLMPPAQPQQVSPGQAILSTIGGHLTQSDQMWLSNNLNGLPGFFNTGDGRELVQMALASFKKHMGVADD